MCFIQTRQLPVLSVIGSMFVPLFVAVRFMVTIVRLCPLYFLFFSFYLIAFFLSFLFFGLTEARAAGLRQQFMKFVR